jgi:hypothetical protein
MSIGVLMRGQATLRKRTTKRHIVGVVTHGTGNIVHSGVGHRVSVSTVATGTAGLPQKLHLTQESTITFWPRAQRNVVSVATTIHGTVTLRHVKATRKVIGTGITGTANTRHRLALRKKITLTVHGTAVASKGVKRSFTDHFTFTSPLMAKVLGKTIIEYLSFKGRTFERPNTPVMSQTVDLTATLQGGNSITVIIFKDPSSTVAASISPPIITFFQRDTAPVLRFKVIDDDTQAIVVLTGATCQFLVRRQNAIANIFDTAQGTGTLTFTTALPNPTHTAQVVTASGSNQSVTVDTTVGTGLPAGTSLMNVGVPGSANYEVCNLGNADSTHVYGIFTFNHSIGEPITAVGVSSPDAIYNAGNGYTTYTVPAGMLSTPGTYFGQLRIQTAAGLVQHSSPVQINVLQGY